MEQLPQELVERICTFLTPDDLKKTLTVSRSLQHASERVSGAFAQFDLTRANAQAFLSLFRGRRWQYLRHVRFRTQLSPYCQDEETESDANDSGETHRCRESPQELQEKDAQFTKEIDFIFTTLRTIEDRSSIGKLQLTIYTPIRAVHDVACAHRKCVSWRLHLQNPDKLPKLNSVRALSLEDENMIFPLEEERSLLHLDLRILIDLAVKLPYLEYLGCQLDGGRGWTHEYTSEEARQYTHDWAGPHRDSRHDLAKALEHASLPSTLRQAQLDFLKPLSSAELIDQTVQVPDLVNPAKHDPFSSSLQLFSYQLRKLELKAVVDASLFWPADGAATWPYLESIAIMFHISSPSGRWYFQGPNGDGHDTKGFEVTDASYPPLMDTPNDETLDEDADDNGVDVSTTTSCKFRVQPNDEVLVPFLTSFARAASNMPALKEACLWTPLLWDPSDVAGYQDFNETQIAKWPGGALAWGITYVAPATLGFHIFPGQHYSDSRQLWWTTGNWRPSDELHHLFHSIGDQTTGLIEHWGHEQYGQKLALRPIFEKFEVFGYRHPDSPWPIKSCPF
ncbi:hypothetical protein BKA66DRAFT_457519 [Pyrenochaeta sp. MPI-SDFR-AT-0127]|nr:hypothetical protein BKA66DRAFT_457519 [Pyrenochaeta sp. MPI-SDFR-AT-0127]